jgi:hypothetical protein
MTMRRSLAIGAAALAAALWAATPAAAKGPVEKLELCGQDNRCAAVVVPHLRDRGLDWLNTARPADHPPRDHSPFYVLRATMPGGETVTMFYAGGATRSERSWARLHPALAEPVAAIAATLPPLREQIAGVTVAGHRVSDAQAYAPLLGNLPAVRLRDTQVNVRSLVSVTIGLSSPTPWSAGGSRFVLYDPAHHAVRPSGAGWQDAPRGLRAALERDAGLSAQGRGTVGRGVAIAVVAAAAGIAVLSLFTLVRRRRYPHPLVVKEES